MYQQNFDKWSSENKYIDEFIQETQLNAKKIGQILEWIPYNKLENIKYLDKGGFSIIYEAIWLDGPIKRYDHDTKKLIRQNNQMVAIKSLNESSNPSDEFLNEV